MGVSRERIRNLFGQVQAMRARPPEVEALEIVPREAAGGFEGSGLLTVGEAPSNPHTLTLALGPVAFQFAHAIANGSSREIAVFGPRGDRKTSTALLAMLWHAVLHAQAGFPLPVLWMGVRDTHTQHRLTTVRTLLHPWWGGVWRIEKDEHLAIARLNGQDLVHLDLIGLEDRGATDKMRMECHGLWFEEPAPATVLVQSSGLDEEAWTLGLTSQRLPTHSHVAVVTSNYPDEDHWSWQRFEANPRAGTKCFRIPPGESASPEQRAEWAQALADRPDLLKRLLAGEPGAIALGPQVAEGFRSDLHVAKDRLHPIPSEPLFLGQDFGLTPATVIGQNLGGVLRIYAGLPCTRGGIRQHFDSSVIPWLTTHAPWAIRGAQTMLRGCYDPAGDTEEESDSDLNPIGTVEQMLGGIWTRGPVKWEARKHVLLSALNRHVGPGMPALQIDPVDARPLIQTLGGRWYYPPDRLGGVTRDLPKKPNHPWEDLGDALIYLLSELVLAVPAGPPAPITVVTQFEMDGRMFGGPSRTY